MGQKAKKGKRRLVIKNWKKKLGNHKKCTTDRVGELSRRKTNFFTALLMSQPSSFSLPLFVCTWLPSCQVHARKGRLAQ